MSTNLLEEAYDILGWILRSDIIIIYLQSNLFKLLIQNGCAFSFDLWRCPGWTRRVLMGGGFIEFGLLIISLKSWKKCDENFN